MSLILALQSKFWKKNVPYLPDLLRRFGWYFVPPKSKDHFAREKGGKSSMEPRSSPPREAQSRHSAVAPKRVLVRWKRPRLLFFVVPFVCCLLCSIDIFIKEKKTKRGFLFQVLPKAISEPLRKPMRFGKRIHQGASCFSKTLYSGFILEEYLRFNRKKDLLL